MRRISGFATTNRKQGKDGLNMRFIVNDNCIACGLCTGICPDVFSMDGDYARAKDEEVSGTVEEKAKEANLPKETIKG